MRNSREGPSPQRMAVVALTCRNNLDQSVATAGSLGVVTVGLRATLCRMGSFRPRL